MATESQTRRGKIADLFTRLDLGEFLAEWIPRRRIPLLIGLGVVLRLAQYLANRSYWLDESSLAGNILQKSWRGMFGPLESTQLAPPGFLLLERAVSRIFGESPWSLRLFPLLCGVATLFLVHGLASRFLRPGAVWIAVGLVALSDDLIYFSTELKQYSSDVAFGLACYFLALAAEERPLTAARAVAFGAAGALVVWFSHASVFVLAGLGTVLFASALRRREGKRALLLVLMGLLWVASFAVVVAVSREQLGHRRDMWAFWNFAFPPVPPRSFWDATWGIRRVLYLFVNPLSFQTVAGPRLSILPIVALFGVGCASLWASSKGRLLMLILPGLFALVASYLHQYPFHGRLLLFLVPSLLLLIAEGAQRVREWAGFRGLLSAAVLAVLFLAPTLDALWHLGSPRDRTGLNPYGDRRPSDFDPTRFPF